MDCHIKCCKLFVSLVSVSNPTLQHGGFVPCEWLGTKGLFINCPNNIWPTNIIFLVFEEIASTLYWLQTNTGLLLDAQKIVLSSLMECMCFFLEPMRLILSSFHFFSFRLGDCMRFPCSNITFMLPLKALSRRRTQLINQQNLMTTMGHELTQGTTSTKTLMTTTLMLTTLILMTHFGRSRSRKRTSQILGSS